MSEEINQVSKAVQEVAKTTGKGIDLTSDFCSFISKYISGPLDEAVGIFEDKLKYTRWENQIRLMQKAQKFLAEYDLAEPDKSIPLKFAVPLLQAASLEDDDYLQDMWAKLLVNAAIQNNKFEIRRVYLDVLERISAFDARILKIIYSIPYEQALHKQIITSNLPDSVELMDTDKRNVLSEPNDEIKMALLNLDRLNCVSIAKSFEGGQLFDLVNQTLLGMNFINACEIKKGKR